MKNILIIMSLLLFLDSFAVAYEKIYLQQPSSYGITPRRTIYRPTYNPYGTRYYSPYQYQRLNSNNIQRLQRLHRLRQMDRLRRSRLSNYLSWFNRNNNGGTLTGYSVPINQDVYKQMGISPYNSNIKQSPKSINCNQELFSNPMGDEMYYTNGEYHKDISGATGKTGVTIIYD